MKKLTLILVLFVFAASGIYSQDENMKKWMDYMTPGEVHKQMGTCTGNWKVHTKFWMSQDGEAAETDGTVTAEMILGGRYLVMKHSGNMMGMPFEGMSIDGYDNASKMYNSVWMDNLGTGIMFMNGKWNEDTKTVDYSGQMVDPMTGGYTDVRSTLLMKEDGSIYMEMFGKQEGKEFKWMELTMTR